MSIEPLTETIGGAKIYPFERRLETEIPLLQQVEILAERDGGLVECYIPTELINHEEVPVKEEWAQSLARQMSKKAEKEGGTGQQGAIQLGWIEGESTFRIIDGFHRDAALMINGQEVIYATVKRTDWNSLYDDRIFTAKDHVHVRFSRVVQWIREVWEHSGLSDKLTVEQAILLYRFDTPGSNLGVQEDDVAAAKYWVSVKEKQWDMAAMTIHSHLKVAENVDPRLIHSTREKRSGHILEAPTQAILKIFSKNLPNQFELQNLVMGTAMKQNLKGPHVKALCQKVQGKDTQSAQAAINEIDWSTWEPTFSESTGRKLRRASDPRHKGAAALAGATRVVNQVAERVQQSLDRGEEVTEEMQSNLDEALRQVKTLSRDLGALAVDLAKLKAANEVKDQAANELAIDEAELKQQLSESVAPRPSNGKAKKESNAVPLRDPNLQPRIRNRMIIMDLPVYGKFTKEDWWVLEPYHRLALALDHKKITEDKFANTAELLKELVDVAKLTPEKGDLESRASLIEFVKPLIAELKAPKRKANIIEFDMATNKIKITKDGKKYLAEVVRNALLEVDEVKDSERQ